MRCPSSQLGSTSSLRSVRSRSIACSAARVQALLNGQLAAGQSIRNVQITNTVLSSALTRAMREALVVRNVARLAEAARLGTPADHPLVLSRGAQLPQCCSRRSAVPGLRAAADLRTSARRSARAPLAGHRLR